MSEHAPDRFWSGIEISKVIAGTLAAITAAVIGSFLGVAGTLAGAAVASVVGSVGTEIYQRSLNRGAKRLSAIAPTFVKAQAAVGTPEVAAATEQESPSHTVVADRRKIRWGRVAAITAAVFVLAMGGIWASEKAFGEPLSTKVGVTDSSGTSLGNAFRTGSSEELPEPVRSVAPSAEPAPDSEQSPEPTQTSGEPTEPTEPAPTAPTEAPTGTDPGTDPDAPQQDSDPGTGSDPNGTGEGVTGGGGEVGGVQGE